MRALALLTLLFAASFVTAHELPPRVAVRMLVAVDAAGRSAEIMVRVPLEAMRDVDFPLEGPGYLRIEQAREALREAAGLWIVDSISLRASGEALLPSHVTTRLALPSNRAFDSLAQAQEHFSGPLLDPSTRIFWRQALLDVRFELLLPPNTAASDLVVDVALQHLGVRTRVDLLYFAANQSESLLSFDGAVQGLSLAPGILSVTGDFFLQGVKHIVSGLDHLLFLICLVLPVRRFWPLVKVVTAFAIAHSITLAAAALGYAPQPLWFPALVEFLIAASIVFLAIENVLRQRFSHRAAIAFLCGLVHGFGFSFTLAEALPFAQNHQLVALASFNLGVEAGQIAVLLVFVLSLQLLSRLVTSERTLILLVSLLVGHTGWHWMSERLERLSGYW
ncbi:MAG: HupE/UreJ family protein [Congregibacter sp.]